jgi:RNA 2',3'-cyclic 3'-phosphodiesterase
MSSWETLRTFIAVPLPEEVTTQLSKVQQQLRRNAPDCVRWVASANIHLTLHFLGDVLADRVDPIREALEVVARNVQPFDFQVGGLGAFPNPRRARVIWVGIKDTTSWLALLQDTVAEAMAHLGFQRESRKFSPHLTLGRVKRDAGAAELHQLGILIEATQVGHLGTVSVEELILFQSTLKPGGAEYAPLGRFKLGSSSLAR